MESNLQTAPEDRSFPTIRSPFGQNTATEPALGEEAVASPEPKRRSLPAWLVNRENISRAAFWIGPFASYCGVELMNNNNPFTSLNIGQIIFNLLWYALIYWVFRMVVGRRNLSAGISATFCFLIGLLNHYVLTFRGRVIFPIDIVCIQTAANVAKDYDYTPDKTVYAALAILAGYIVLLLLVPRHPGRNKLRLRSCIISWGVIGGFLFAFFCTGLLPAVGIYSQQWRTQQNGWLLNFMTSLSYSFVQEPEGYSEDRVNEIAQRYTGTAGDAEAYPENLIVIMNESFSDFSGFDKLELSDDPAPFYHSLTENTIKGTMYSPVHGGGTANVEFEYLTGDSLSFLPSSTVAYQLYLYDGCPSLVSLVDELGYHTIAFHPYYSSGWNRTSVYDWLGFDEQWYDEDVEDPSYVRGYISDSCDYSQLYQFTEETEGPTFIFNVTMQNHSSYAQGWNNLSRDVELTGDSADKSSVADQYFSLIRASDDAIRELIEYYSNCEERTMIVFFGDHQPPLENSFYEYLYGKSLDDRTTEEAMLQYETPFFIWANYDIPEAQDVRLGSNFLGTLTAQVAGFPLTGYMQLHADLMEEFEAITPIGILTTDGTATEDVSDLTETQQALYDDYRIMAYNHLFDEDNHPDGFYE